ncbi:hypothetical protein AB0N93_25080 [Streptomyces sp. NPDC091267]|uniref:hypothetical protein n=1 Tax=Streptomyces sp. NPDC091267 TaxID=3155195 RepID=UPI003444057A
MSSSDQQHPYPQQPYGQQPQPGQQQPYRDPADPSYDGQAYGERPQADQGYPDPAYGQQPYGGQPYGDPSYGDPSYGQQAPYAGDPAGYGTQGAYGPPQAPQHPHQAARQQPYEPQQAAQQPYESQQPQQASQPQPGAGWPAGQQGVAQTWEGQTWDTQYQPTIRPAQVSQPSQQAQGVAPDRPAADNAYLPPQGASGSYPLPPEAAATPGAPAPEAAPAAAAPGEDGYSAPTTLGNSRITDAQRARAEGRSPIIAPGLQPAAITAGLGLLLALGAAVGSYALVVPLVLLQAVTAAGWFRLNGMWPARQGIALAFAGGLVADVALLAAGRENGPAAILGTLGVWVLLTVVLQLRSRADADERMQGLMATVASAALAILAAGHLAAVPDAVTVGGVAVALAVLVRALPLPGPASVVAALVVAAGAGAVAGVATDLGVQGALLGLAAGGCALIGLRVASYDYPSRFVHMTAGVALPLTAAAPAVYLIGRMIS